MIETTLALVRAALVDGLPVKPGELAARLALSPRSVARSLRVLAERGEAHGSGSGRARRYVAAELHREETIAALAARALDVLRVEQGLSPAQLAARLGAPLDRTVRACRRCKRSGQIRNGGSSRAPRWFTTDTKAERSGASGVSVEGSSPLAP